MSATPATTARPGRRWPTTVPDGAPAPWRRSPFRRKRPTDTEWFAQRAWRVRLEWGARGADTAARRGDLLVVVDTLRFSTAVATAVAAGARVWPVAAEAEALRLAQGLGARTGREWLSPARCAALNPGDRLVLASPNGATCSRCGRIAPALWTAAPVNAAAVARAVAAALDQNPDAAATVVACGERWDWNAAPDSALRFALEDFLGAGAVLARLGHARSPEAQAAVDAFHGVADLAAALRDCGSGIELIDKGREEDVRLAARVDALDVAPRLQPDGALDDPSARNAGPAEGV